MRRSWSSRTSVLRRWRERSRYIRMRNDLGKLDRDLGRRQHHATMLVAMAARGIPSYFAVSGFCANVIPRAPLTSRTPVAPSDAVPDKMTPIARL